MKLSIKSSLLFPSILLAVTPYPAHAQNNNVNYAVHSAAFGASIAYCRAKYGALNPNSKAGNCFLLAKDALAEAGLPEAVIKINGLCPDAATLSGCMTPELSSVVYRILGIFEAKKL